MFGEAVLGCVFRAHVLGVFCFVLKAETECVVTAGSFILEAESEGAVAGERLCCTPFDEDCLTVFVGAGT